MRRRTVVQCLGFCLAAILAPVATAADAWALVYADRFDASERGERLAVARSLEGRVRYLSNAIAPLTPKASEQLSVREASLADDSPASRARSRLYLSADFQQRELRGLLDEINAALTCIPRAPDESAEMACWSRAAVALQEDQKLRVALGVLRDRRVLPKDRTFPVDGQDPEIWYDAYGKGILRYIIHPYLERGSAAAVSAVADSDTEVQNSEIYASDAQALGGER